jgi:hypothetical protein
VVGDEEYIALQRDAMHFQARTAQAAGNAQENLGKGRAVMDRAIDVMQRHAYEQGEKQADPAQDNAHPACQKSVRLVPGRPCGGAGA